MFSQQMEMGFPIWLMNQIFHEYPDSEGNYVFSPICNLTFFQLLSELVGKESISHIKNRYNLDLEQIASLKKKVSRMDKKFAYSIFQISNYPLNKETEVAIKEEFDAEIESFNDQNISEMKESIKKWLKMNSNERCEELVNGPSINRSMHYIVNWATAFDKTKTTTAKFSQTALESIDVNMMNISGKFKYAENEKNAVVIELPCVTKAGVRQKDRSVLVYLPSEECSDYDSLTELTALMKNMDNVDLDVFLPKFKMNSISNMTSDLIPNGCNFSKFSNSNAYAKQILTKAFMEINEDNITVSALTGCDICFQPILKEIIIECEVSNRFARTLMTHKFYNANNDPQETTFCVILPENAFITEFVMVIEGKSYKSYVKEKEEAKQTYDEAVARGRSAAHVAVSARDSNKFTVSVNVAPKSEAKFMLTYEELLERKFNQYELVLNVNPGQLLEKLSIKVGIEESSKISFVKVPPVRSGNKVAENNEGTPPQTVLNVEEKKAFIEFNPTTKSQKDIAKTLGNDEEKGIAGQFVVQYDVEVDKEGGEVLLRDGYFVHFNVSDDLPALPKHVVFALDTSGSMSGRKIQQLREAMVYILDQIKPDDLITMLDFSHRVTVHDFAQQLPVIAELDHVENYLEIMHKFESQNLPEARQATEAIINSAKVVAQNLKADGSTNMICALVVSLFLIKKAQAGWKNHQPILIFLTDGEPTDGLSSTEAITDVVTRLNMDIQAPIFSLSFGEDADKMFLRKLSLKNLGFSKHIYEAADASLQLKQFYKQISSPVMSNVTFKYEDDINDLTRNKFPIYFQGCDLVVCGRYNLPNHLENVKCHRNDQEIFLNPRIIPSSGPLEKFWAFLTVKQLLEKSNYSEDGKILKTKAIELALKYSFVTEVTSLVVVKPEENVAVDPENASVTSDHWRIQPPRHAPLGMSSFNSSSAYIPMSPTVSNQLPVQQCSSLMSAASFSGFGRSALFGNAPVSCQMAGGGGGPVNNLFGSNNYSQTRIGMSSFVSECHSGPGETNSQAAVDLSGNYSARVPIKKSKNAEEKDMGKKIFRVDRPFFIILQSKMQNEIVILFIGKVTKPTY